MVKEAPTETSGFVDWRLRTNKLANNQSNEQSNKSRVNDSIALCGRRQRRSYKRKEHG
jgi:hypothetical protein